MLDRQSPHPRMTPSTGRRIASLALARAFRHALRTIEAPGFFPMTVFVDRRGKVAYVHSGEYRKESDLAADIKRYVS